MNVISFPYKSVDNESLIEEYREYILGKSDGTVDAYIRILYQFLQFVSERPGGLTEHLPDLFTKTAVETFLDELEQRKNSVSHRTRVKSVLKGFASWLMEEKDLLAKNPVKRVELPAQAKRAPRELTEDQRYVLKTLVERKGDQRSAAIFALGYWAGCRISDVSWLTMENTHVGPKVGSLKVGYKGGKYREIDILNYVRRPLFEYIHGEREASKFADSPYLFMSKRGGKLTEAGIHHWLRTLKSTASLKEAPLIEDITFHDLRHDFAHRARASGWLLEEIAEYLGHIKKNGAPAIETTVLYTQPTRAQIKEKLSRIRG